MTGVNGIGSTSKADNWQTEEAFRLDPDYSSSMAAGIPSVPVADQADVAQAAALKPTSEAVNSGIVGNFVVAVMSLPFAGAIYDM